MQLHLQVHPDSFAGYWNAAQCLAGVQLAVGANSPFLLGSRLWAETRIPLFEQSCDVRTPELRNQGVRPRVWFGERWITSILDLFAENGRYFPALHAASPRTPTRWPSSDAGRVPGARRAAAAQRHDLALEPPGLRHRRRRAARARGEPGAAGRADGRRHGGERAVLLRPAARARRGRAAAVELDVVRGRRGELHHRGPARAWTARCTGRAPAGSGPTSWCCASCCRRPPTGLARWGVAGEVIDRYLSVIEQRCVTRRTGAAWQLDAVAALEDARRRPARRPCTGCSTRYLERVGGQRAGAHLAGPLRHTVHYRKPLHPFRPTAAGCAPTVVDVPRPTDGGTMSDPVRPAVPPGW